MKPFMYVWVVRRGKDSCIWLRFSEAWEDVKSLWDNDDRALIFPKLMWVETYENIGEFNGW